MVGTESCYASSAGDVLVYVPGDPDDPRPHTGQPETSCPARRLLPCIKESRVLRAECAFPPTQIMKTRYLIALFFAVATASLLAQPANDNFASATMVSANTSVSG